MAVQYVATFLKPEMLHVYRQISALRHYRPLVLCQKREGAAAFPWDDVRVVPKPRTHAWRRFWQKTVRRQPITIYQSEARRLATILQEVSARVLHVYFGHIGVHLLPLLERTPVPVIVSFHGADAQVDHERAAFRERLRAVFRQARLILVRSGSIGERLVAAGCPAEKIRLHRTGLPLQEIAYTARPTPPEGEWRALQACRLIAKKGLPTTLRAFAEFAQRWPRATLTIAGEGPMVGEVEAMVEALGLRGRVHLPGFVGQERLRTLMAEAHFFLHPSEVGPNGDQEGVPNSMLEAMASGLPVLATRHGGIPEAVTHGQSGLLGAERDASALAAAMLALAADPARREAMGAAASAQVRRDFDLAVQARVLEGYYDEAAGG